VATINRKVLRSISELSSFKFMLVFYLVFFIISAIIMGLIGLLAWLGLSSTGLDINQVLQNFGLGNLGMFNIGGGSTLLYVIIFIIGGLIFSVFYAAFGTLMVWIVNVILRISGGIELRFIERKDMPKPQEQSESESQ
jgi:hypothetical protein